MTTRIPKRCCPCGKPVERPAGRWRKWCADCLYQRRLATNRRTRAKARAREREEAATTLRLLGVTAGRGGRKKREPMGPFRPTVRVCCGQRYPFHVKHPTPCPRCGRLGYEKED